MFWWAVCAQSTKNLAQLDAAHRENLGFLVIKPTDKNRTPQDSFAVLQSHFQSGRPPYGICLIYGDSGVLSGFENSLKRKLFPRARWIVWEIGKMLMALAVFHHLAISNEVGESQVYCMVYSLVKVASCSTDFSPHLPCRSPTNTLPALIPFLCITAYLSPQR